MKAFSRLICLLSLGPMFLMANGQMKDMSKSSYATPDKVDGFLQAWIRGAGFAAMECTTGLIEEAKGYVNYQVGSDDDRLSVQFPIDSIDQLIQMEPTPDYQIAMFMDGQGLYLCSAATMDKDQYEQTRRDILDVTDEGLIDMTIDNIVIEERDGTIYRMHTLTCKDLTDGQSYLVIRQRMILTPNHLFTIMVSNSLEVMQEGSVSAVQAEAFLNSWYLY